jgi:hypothetical protein
MALIDNKMNNWREEMDNEYKQLFEETTNIFSELLQKSVINNINITLINDTNSYYLVKSGNDIPLTLKKSVILTCVVTNIKTKKIITTKTKYRAILIDIWKTMSQGTLLTNTTYNFKSTNENGLKGFIWCKEISLSFQDKNADGAIEEIINTVKLNAYSLYMKIRLQTNEIVRLIINNK